MALALAAAAVLAGLTGCGTERGTAPPDETIRITPSDGATRVAVRTRVTVSVREGRLRHVRVRARQGGPPLPGRISADGRTWRPYGRGRLAAASAYAVDAVARDARGERVTRRTAFTTRAARHRLIGYFTPEHRQTVGIGMIVSIRFNRPVVRRAAVQRAIRVTARPRVPVAAHWFGRTRLDFRPRRYWRPGTRVALDLRLRGVRGAPRTYGVQHKRVWFRVGRDQRSVVEADRHRMTVYRAGRAVARVPVTTGSPENRTYSGRMVITEKAAVTRMNGDTVGFGGQYDIKDVPHAMRLTDSGTFLHGNYWAEPGVFGARNVSHGCVGLRDVRGGSARSPAGAFFRRSLVGDVVTVRGSGEERVAPDNGLGGWNMSWREWRAG
ncbi:L,D-transpeptidase [Streptomyces sp. SB3404]|uniref:L,D-transpeptidase n=1 Tax=Streptomyces boncukensis TaxID=2711219 RepID=A0A6G4X148_9ACTN|nr:L,D-transpeptidase [Streptomyces boncukensis]